MKKLIFILVILFSFNTMALDASTILAKGKIIYSNGNHTTMGSLVIYHVIYNNNLYWCSVKSTHASCKIIENK